MKKVLFFAVIVLCAVSGIKAQDIVNLRMDRQQMGLRGLVASMDEDQLLRKDYFREDWPQRKWFVKDLRNVLREEDGRIVTFNPAGRMLSVTYTHQGKMGAKTLCTYAPNGLLSSFTGEGYKIVAKYSGNMADINVFAETKKYAPNVDIARANLSGASFTYTYPFDLKCRQELGDDGLVLSSSYYYVDSMLARECQYNYNHNNLLTSEKTIDYTSGEKSVSITKYTYDNRGFLIKKVVNSKAIDATFTYENNELGDCTKMTVERPYGTVVYTFEYQYDNQQNWTVRLEFEDGVFDNATLRSFTYHKDSGKATNNSQKASDKGKKVKQDNSNSSDKAAKAAEKNAEKERIAAEKKAEKERIAAEKAAKKEAEARQKEAAKAEKQRIEEEERNMTKEERKAAQAARKAAEKERKALEKAQAKEKAEAEKAAKEAAKAAEKERKALEKAQAKEKAEAEKAAKDAAKAAEKAAKEQEKAAKEQAKAAEKERKAAEKAAEKERKAAEKASKK